MFGDKQLHEVGSEELTAFLEERREEGVLLDYKQSWTHRIIETACAFANTYGGYLFYGVKEVAQPNRPNQPNPEDVPGIDFSKGDPVASLRSRILDNTRPSVEPEIRAVPLKGSKDRGILVIRIEESVDAPHEILATGATRIPVRRADTTVAASLDEIEQLIRRRDALRGESARTVDIQFFSEKFSAPPDGFGGQSIPPTMGMMIRPRRINSLHFAFDSRLDREMRSVALQHDVGTDLPPKPMPSGVVMEDLEDDIPKVRIEVHKNGVIRSAHALSRVPSSRLEFSSLEDRPVQEKWLDFEGLALSVCAVVRFAAEVYALKRPSVEMEVWFGLSNCQGYKTKIPIQSPFRSYSQRVAA